MDVLYSQSSPPGVQADIGWNGRLCNGGHGICYIRKNQNAARGQNFSGAVLSYDKKNKSLVITLDKNALTPQEINNILYEPLQDGMYLYTLEEEFMIPEEVKDALGLPGVRIKPGHYLVKTQKNQIILYLKLE